MQLAELNFEADAGGCLMEELRPMWFRSMTPKK